MTNQCFDSATATWTPIMIYKLIHPRDSIALQQMRRHCCSAYVARRSGATPSLRAGSLLQLGQRSQPQSLAQRHSKPPQILYQWVSRTRQRTRLP